MSGRFPLASHSPAPSLAIPASPAIPPSLLDRPVLLGLFVLAAFATACTLPMQNDTWWHLRMGQIIWAARAVPGSDPFSFSIPAGYPYYCHEWLSQVVMYGAYALGGPALLTLLCAALVTAALLPTLALIPGRPFHRAALLFIAMPLIRVGWSARPQVFTLACFALTLWLLAQRRYRCTALRVATRYLFLPLLFLLWANLHGGVALGGVLVMGALLAAALFGEPGLDRARWRRRIGGLCGLAALCGAATLCTPLGLHILLFPLEGTRRSRDSGNIEFQSPDLHSVGGVLSWAAMALFCFLLLTRWRRLRSGQDRLLAVLGVLLLPMALTSMRTVPHFLLVAVPVMARLAPFSSAPASSAPVGSDRDLRWLLAGAALTAAFVVYAFVRPLPRLAWHPMSAAAAAAVRAAPQPTYNTYDDGGYLIWFVPDHKVFVDSREYSYPEELILSANHAFLSGDYQALFARYRFRSAVVRPGDRVGAQLIRSGWKQRYADAQWLVIEHAAD